MGDLSIPPPDGMRSRRRYDSPTRREQATKTRERIVAAGADLVRGFPAWDWDDLTFRAVAERAGVSERTVYRNFPSERHLHDAVMAQLEDDAGVSYDDIALDDVAGVTARVFESLHRFAIEDSGHTPGDPTFAGADTRRRDALMRAVSTQARHWGDTERRVAAGLLDVLWSPTTYERLVRAWKLDDSQATGAVGWLIGKVVEAVQHNEPPAAG
ncbi:MAG TPA: TetR/AcrR family transcriptional regulator [Mycobacterium sp.]|nr:TetR/AcrR family transcriptional regulator [Mycobacterium sp.]